MNLVVQWLKLGFKRSIKISDNHLLVSEGEERRLLKLILAKNKLASVLTVHNSGSLNSL